MKLILILLQIQQLLTDECPVAYSRLNPSLSVEVIEAKLKVVGADNKYLSELYHWRDGMKIVWDEKELYYFASFGYLLSLDDAIKIYDNPNNKEFKKAGLFPIIANYIGDYVFINIDGKQKDRGKIYCYSPALFDIKPEIAFDNIEALFGMIEECYRLGIYKEDKKEGLIVDYDKEAVIIRKYSNAQYWK